MEPLAPKAVFLSYASQDAAAARHIADALHASGIEIWFDQSELRGGDVWDQKLRRQIKECALFIAVISKNTDTRLEGYFRREWKLAIDRTHNMAEERAFLLPVVIDDTSDNTTHVPDKFHDVQWTRLPDGETPPAFVERVKALLQPRTSDEVHEAGQPSKMLPSRIAGTMPAPSAKRAVPAWVLAVVAVVVFALGLNWLLRPPTEPAQTATEKTTAATGKSRDADTKSIAVLAFANLSAEKEYEYFSDGISEELLNVLVKIPGLRVSARTSAFSFKGKNTPIPEIAQKLGVAYVVEGSVRKAGDRVRITAQLIKAADGFHVWSKAYDRELKDIIAVQDEIAQTIVGELRGTLLHATGGSAKPVMIRAEVQAAALGGTKNPEAYQRYLQGRFFLNRGSPEDFGQAVAHFLAATELDPRFAQAWAELGRAYGNMAQFALTALSFADGFEKAQAAAEQALKLEPDLAAGHLVIAQVQMVRDWNVRRADESLRRALALAPGDASVVGASAMVTLFRGQTDQATVFGRRSVVLDPVNAQVRVFLALVHLYSGRLAEAEGEIRRALELNPSVTLGSSILSYVFLLQGRHDEALASAEREKEEHLRLVPIALARLAQGKRAEADAALNLLIEKYSDKMAFNVAQIYAVRGDVEPAFAWLERACQLRDSGLAHTKLDPFLRNLHADPRWTLLLKQLGLADEP